MNNIDNTLLDIINKVWTKLPIIIICAIIGLILGNKYTDQIKPSYTAKVTFMAVSNNDVEKLSKGINNISIAQGLISTYIEILRTDDVLEKVAEATGLDYTAGEIRGMMRTSTSKDTPIFGLSITGSKAEDTIKIVNTIAEIAPQEIFNVLRVGYIQILDEAKVALPSTNTNRLMNLVMGMVVGAGIPTAIILLLILLDTRIYNEKDLESYYDLPVLTSIPNLSYSQRKSNRRKKNG